MKKIIVILIIILLTYAPSLKAQEMDLGSSTSSGAPVTFDGTINLTDATIILDGTIITCKTLIIKNTVTTIKVTGKVTINCKSLIIDKALIDLTFDIKGRLEGYYAKDFDGNSRKIKIIGAKNEGFTITEKTD